MKAWRSVVSREAGGEAFFELFAIAWEHEAEWAAEDDAIWVERDSDRGETEEHAIDNVRPDVFFGDSRDETAILGIDGAGGGDIFPFFGFALEDEFGVARFKIRVALYELAVFDDTATDAGREGQVERAAFTEAGFGQSGKIGVVFNENWNI